MDEDELNPRSDLGDTEEEDADSEMTYGSGIDLDEEEGLDVEEEE